MDPTDRLCERCPQHWVTVWRHLAPIASVLELRFCNHHTKRHATALLAAEWRLITDTRPPIA